MIFKRGHDDSMERQLLEALEKKDFARFSELLLSAKKGDGNRAMEEAIYQHSLECVKILIPLCDDITLGGPCILDAALYGYTDLVRDFIPFADQDNLSAALCTAIAHKHESSVMLLLPHVDATCDQSYALQLAASKMRTNKDCPIFEAVFAVSNPQDALNALMGRGGSNTAAELLEQRMNLELNKTIHAQIAPACFVKTRKI